MKQNEVEKLLKYWQKQLRMSDYIIKLNYCTPDDFPEDQKGYWGLSKGNTVHRSGKIWVLQEQYASTDGATKYDVEYNLIHELLHFKFDILQEEIGDIKYRLLHYAIDDLARALACSKRGESIDILRNC